MELNHKITEIYDKNKVGRLVARGLDHTVYDYDTDKVIKFSFHEFFHKHGKKKIIQDYLICREFFGDYVLDTKIIGSPHSKRTVLIQPKVTGRYLLKEDLKTQEISKQFGEILSAYNSMKGEIGHEIDLIGHKGFFKDVFSNIFVTQENKLCIIDASILEFRGAGIFYPVLELACKIWRFRQRQIIKKFSLI